MDSSTPEGERTDAESMVQGCLFGNIYSDCQHNTPSIDATLLDSSAMWPRSTSAAATPPSSPNKAWQRATATGNQKSRLPATKTNLKIFF